MNKWMNEWMNEWMDGRTDGRTDGCGALVKTAGAICTLRVEEEDRTGYVLSASRSCDEVLQPWTKRIKTFCTFLPTESLSRWFGTTKAPPFVPPRSMLLSRGEKWSSRTSTFLRGGGAFLVVSSAFNKPFEASQSRGTKPLTLESKSRTGTRQTKDIHNLKW